MLRVKDIGLFYRTIHELESLFPNWWEVVGIETENGFIDTSNVDDDPAKIFRSRELLMILRDQLGVAKARQWRGAQRKNAIRLKVTYYANFGLKPKEIATLLNIPASTIRHDYPPLKDGEMLEPSYELQVHDKFGRHLKAGGD